MGVKNSALKVPKRFFEWYERHYAINVTISALLFATQLVHLYWLSTHVVALKLTGLSFFQTNPAWQMAIVSADYLEIPALLSSSLLYLYHLNKGFSRKYLLLLLAINVQWVHLLWITDEFVLEQIASSLGFIWPIWLSWVAIIIDYLELPAIWDTSKRFFELIKRRFSNLTFGLK